MIYGAIFPVNRFAAEAGWQPLSFAFQQALFAGLGLAIAGAIGGIRPALSGKHLGAYVAIGGLAVGLPVGLLVAAAKARMDKAKQKESFSTKAMRDLELLRRTRVFTRTLVRVQLPDRSLLQAVFSPQEPLAAVAAELRAALAPDAQRPFFLYTTPPMTRLPDERATLRELGLLPAALVYMGWLDADGAPQGPAPLLLPHLLEAGAGPMQVDGAAAAFFPRSIPVAQGQPAAATSGAEPAPRDGRDARDADKPDKPKPKWFKL